MLTVVTYWPSWVRPKEPFDLIGFIVTFAFVSVPVGYVFGIIPALLGGAMYCGALTAAPRLRSQTLVRAFLAATVGGVIGGLWSYGVLGFEPIAYGSVAALTAGLLALRWPRPPET